jgi:hypothetical protein
MRSAKHGPAQVAEGRVGNLGFEHFGSLFLSPTRGAPDGTGLTGAMHDPV